MGSPDPRQIDGMGGADPLTSKVAVVRRSARDGRRCRLPVPAGLRGPRRSSRDAQNCGNILAGVGPFAIERGLVAARDGETDGPHLHGQHRPDRRPPRSHTPGGGSATTGDARIDGVPGTHAAGPDRVRGHRRVDLRGAAAHRATPST